MKKMSRFALFALAFLMSVQVVFVYKPPQKVDAFDPSIIISDSVFENTASMNASQIDAFLNNIGSSCIRQASGFVSPQPLGYSSGAYRFGGNVTAGQSLASIAQNYNLNPQVLITTLQKEQAITTGGAGCHYDRPNPTDPAQVFACDLYHSGRSYRCTQACPYAGGCMNIAMGYGCPGYCNVDLELFQMQLSAASWYLRFAEQRSYGRLSGYAGFDSGDDTYSYSGPMTPGYRQRVAGGANTYYDGTYTTNDGTTVTITNGATASLYSYTPFVSGNSKFQNIFQTTFGFGSATTGACLGNESQLPYVQRYYNPRTYEHFYSAYACDQGFLRNIGYNLEGPVFNDTPCTATYAVPVYRLYNPRTQQHFWTTDNLSQSQLDAGGSGYRQEAGIVFCVATPGMPGTHTVHRLYNPNTYLHLWAVDPTLGDMGNISRAGYAQSDGPAFYTQ